jgi:hypothetical protein
MKKIKKNLKYINKFLKKLMRKKMKLNEKNYQLQTNKSNINFKIF